MYKTTLTGLLSGSLLLGACAPGIASMQPTAGVASLTTSAPGDAGPRRPAEPTQVPDAGPGLWSAPEARGSGALVARTLRVERIAGEAPRLSEVARRLHRGAAPSGQYRLCVDGRGQVRAVKPLREVAAADTAIMAALQTWRFRPQGMPFCYTQDVSFLVD